MNNRDKINVVANALLLDIFCKDWHILSHEELKHISNFIDYEDVSDRIIADNPEIIKVILWERVKKMKIIRLIARNKDILNFVSLRRFDYSVNDIQYLLKIHPDLIDSFGIDLENLNQKDALTLLTVGESLFVQKIKIKNYDFNFIETFRIVEAHDFKRNIIEQIQSHKLKSYDVAEILRQTGKESMDLLNLRNLTANNWIYILKYQPDLWRHCNSEIFLKGDIFPLVELLILLNNSDAYFLLEQRNYKKDLSALGWEKLIIHNPEKFIHECNLKKLNKNNWERILYHNPELIKYKN